MKQYFNKPSKVSVERYSACKYSSNPGNCEEIHYDNVEAFEVVEGTNAAKLEAEMDGSLLDDYHEYLIIYFANGGTATYRNSYADLFMV